MKSNGLTSQQELEYAGVPKGYFNDVARPAEDNILQMGKHSEDGKPVRGNESARDAKEAGEIRKANEVLDLNKIMEEGWTEKQEASTVKYLRDKNETITKNKYEGTFSSDSPYRRQTDAVEWELKSMSRAERSGSIVKGIVEHAENGSAKYTGTEHIGRVLIDARNQRFMTEAVAEKAMLQAFREVPDLKEIRIVCNYFDMSLKRGQKTAVRN